MFGVKAFVEKPDHATAESYLESGDYFWNAGKFLFLASALMAAFERYAARFLEASGAALKDSSPGDVVRKVHAGEFEVCPS